MEQRGSSSSKRTLLLALSSVSAFALACFLLLWTLTREQGAGRTTTSSEAPTAGPVDVRPFSDSGELLATSPPAAPVPATSQFIVVPLFDTHARWERGRSAALSFRVDRVPSGVANGVELTMSVSHLPDRKEMRLKVRENGGGEYEADFDPPKTGQYQLTASVRDGVARTSLPVVLNVVEGPLEAAGQTLAGLDNGGGSSGAGLQRGRSAYAGGGRHGR